MTKPFLLSSFSALAISFLLLLNPAAVHPEHDSASASLVKKSQRTSLVETEYGQVSEVKIYAGERGPYHLEFITLDPNSLFLPVLLHADMVFYVHTGSGTLSWADDNEAKTVKLQRGDIYRLQPGSVFYIESSLGPEREKLRIHAFFSNADDDCYEASIGAYSSIADLVFGFHTKTLQSAFKVPEEVIEAMRNRTRPQVIVHAESKKIMTFRGLEARFLKTILGRNRGDFFDFDNKKKKKTKVYNIFEAKPDFKNCYGWSTTVDRQDLRILKGSNVGVFMVNLTKGSMMGPHWNPSATEIAVVLQGEGMVRVVCSSRGKQSECKNMRFRVEAGDAFAVPRFHPMAQMSFNNDSFIFMGFSTTAKKNYPQFLAGKSSVFQVMDKGILALSLNVTNTTLCQILSQQVDSFILDCTSCAEEEEEARKKEEEEARKREEEEEEEARRQEEERRKREKEQEQKREEEEARKREEEKEEAMKREEEEAKKREEEEQEEARRQEEERRQREKEQERKREEEEEARQREEEEASKREEEEKKQKEKQQERKREEEEKHWEEEEASKRAEKRREKEERSRREEAAAREQEEARSQEKERQRRAREGEEEAEWGEPETTLKRRAFWI